MTLVRFANCLPARLLPSPSSDPSRGQRIVGWMQRLRRIAALLVLALPGLPSMVHAQDGVIEVPAVGGVVMGAPLRFGILPLGGAFESRNDWGPVLADLSRAIGRPVSVLSVTSYGALEEAIRRNEVDMAFLSGRMALDAVTQHGMMVVAQVTRHDGLPGYRALLLARKGDAPASLDALLAEPERWRIARGERRSVSGFIVPQLQLFLPRHIQMETRFRSELVGTHQYTALAVANGDADVATNNTADLERFRLQFPSEAARLRVLWQSELIPHAQIVMRRSYPPAFQQQVRDFLVGYGRAPGPTGDAERALLKSLHDLAGFVAADDASLRPAAELAYQLARQSAMEAQWVDTASRDARLARLAREYEEQMRLLGAGAGGDDRPPGK